MKPIRLIAKLSALGLILINILAATHAYKFTNFKKQEEHHPSKIEQKGIWTSLKYAIMGIDHPRAENKGQPSVPYKSFFLEGSKKIHAWHLVHPGDTLTRGSILCLHGYAGDKSGVLDRGEEFYKMGFDVLLIDFRGSGLSEGNTTTIGYKECEEVKLAFDFLKDSLGSSKIFIYGNSMGAAAAMKAMDAYQLSVKGLILECPFGSMYQTTCARFKMMGLPPVPFAALLVFWGGVENGFWAFGHNPIKYASRIDVPTLLMYGEVDNRVSPEETNVIFSNLKGAKTLKTFPNIGHENFLQKSPDQWHEAVVKFFDTTPDK